MGIELRRHARKFEYPVVFIIVARQERVSIIVDHNHHDVGQYETGKYYRTVPPLGIDISFDIDAGIPGKKIRSVKLILGRLGANKRGNLTQELAMLWQCGDPAGLNVSAGLALKYLLQSLERVRKGHPFAGGKWLEHGLLLSVG